MHIMEAKAEWWVPGPREGQGWRSVGTESWCQAVGSPAPGQVLQAAGLSVCSGCDGKFCLWDI